MRFGVLLIGPFEGSMDPAQVYQQSLLQARTAVANNFDALFAAQHYLSGPAAAMMQPLVLLANLAAEAQGLYLGTALYLLPLHHPVAAAEQTATLDIISGGKFFVWGRARVSGPRVPVLRHSKEGPPAANGRGGGDNPEIVVGG